MWYNVYMIINTDDCWLYAGTTSSNDYGRIWVDGKSYMVHRLMWMDANNRVIPEGLHTDHLCRVHRCINPAHLDVVTPRENALRGATVAAAYSKRRACKYGHTFDKKNTRMRGNTRVCRTCQMLWQRDYHAKRRANAL